MGSRLNNKNVGTACAILGGLFILGGIVLFILYNSVNLYAQKADATIVSKYRVESEDDPHTVLELAYRVGDDMVYATDSYYGEIDDETVNLDIYYNVKDPKQILDAGWHFEPVIPAAFGVLILLTGLYYTGHISFGFEPAKKPGKDSSDWDKKYYAAKEKAENALIPMLGVISFVVFGVFLVVFRVEDVEVNAVGVFDRRAQPVEDLEAEVLRKPQRLVCRLEVIFFRIFRIKVHQRKDEMRVDDALSLIPKRPVVRPRRVASHRLDVGVVVADGARVDSLPGKVDGDVGSPCRHRDSARNYTTSDFLRSVHFMPPFTSLQTFYHNQPKMPPP